MLPILLVINVKFFSTSATTEAIVENIDGNVYSTVDTWREIDVQGKNKSESMATAMAINEFFH